MQDLLMKFTEASLFILNYSYIAYIDVLNRYHHLPIFPYPITYSKCLYAYQDIRTS